MRIEEDIKLDFDDVLLKPKRSSLKSRKDFDLEREFQFKYSKNIWKGIPIIASNMDTSGTFEISNVFRKKHLITAAHKFYSIKDWENQVNNLRSLLDRDRFSNYVWPTIGMKEIEHYEDLSNIFRKSEIYPKFLVVDVANGYTERFVNTIKELRDDYSDVTIVAGNVATPEGVEALVFAGADIIKIFIGPGRQCRTRMVAGVGYPTFSATVECSDAAHGLGAHIIADGGIKQIADFGKYFAAGADFVMAGSYFAGHDESGGKLVEIDGKKYKEVYGMSSDHAMKKYYGKKDEYRSSEGEYNYIEYKGPVENTVNEILGGIRSTATYIGARRMKDMSKCATFIRVNRIK